MRTIRFLIIALLTLILLSCSRIKFAYNQLDWLIPYYLETYMELTEEQNVYVEEQLEDLLAWHCSRQLPGYVKLFRSANLKFQTGQTTRDDLEKYSTQFEQYWEALILQVIPVMSQLFLTSSEEQISELFKRLDERNREWLEEYRAQTAAERSIEYQERVGEELERWFGPLNNGQRHEITKWSGQFRPLGMEGLEMRKKWQQRLRGLIVRRKDQSSISSGLEELILSPEQFRSTSYQNLLDENKKVTIELIYQVGKQLNQSQREHLAVEIMSVATDFEELACQGDYKVKPGSDRLAAISE